jgi:hypothetical protein
MGTRSSFLERMFGAAMLSAPIYEEVEHDRTATGQAAGVVALVAIASAIGAWGHGGLAVFGSLVSAFVGWILWSAITLFIGTRIFNGTSDMGEQMRALGFAQSAGVLYVLGIIPILGWMVKLAVGLWVLVCGIVAVRQALDFTTGKAVGTVVIGWLVYIVLAALFGVLFGWMF